ncbi:Retrovirus-related Pol polyprotein from transposon RE2 [Vitis vinifera]|uniref:Retrovirus-related Pol polyprotein from transposon RE2 n=1 Tax=Vitis vinifera TaxID=29760 RepID=A0A438BVQ1_VITVI|nr:Retrovirus-related Pol polyprotein from transposon RE2 [Vitis vinifera]
MACSIEALLIGYDLLDYVTGISQCPSPSDLSVSALHKTHWVRQDKLILSAFLASTSPTITPLIATAKMSHEAWQKLNTLYASKSRTRAMQLKEELTLIQRGNRPISDYLHAVLISGKLQHQSELAKSLLPLRSSTIFWSAHEHYLRRLETATQQLVAAANYTTRKSGSSGGQQRSYSKPNGPQRQSGQAPARSGNCDGRRPNGSNRPSNNQRPYRPKCQFCDELGHTTKNCPQLKPSEITANSATTSTMKEQKWLLDFAASHNITGDLQNLSIHSEYDGTDEVVLGDGSGLAISHIHKTYVSRHVLFDETQLPFQSEQAQSPDHRESSSHLCPTSFIPFSSQPVRVPPQVILSVHSSDSAPSHVLPADVSAASPSPPGNPPIFSPNFPLTDVLRNSGSHSDVLILHDPVLPSSLHPTHTHTVADLTLSQSHSIPPSCVQTGNPRLHKMTTRSMNNIFKPKQLHLVSKHPIPLAIEPTYVTQVVNHP